MRALHVHSIGGTTETLLAGQNKEDLYLLDAFHLVRNLEQSNIENTNNRLETVYAAWDIYQGERNKLVRQELEARLLTHDSFFEISRRFHATEEIVKCYHAIFFDVRDRLDSRSYIINRVIHDPKSVLEPEFVIWKLCAYWGGSETLDLLIYKDPIGLFKASDEDERDGILLNLLRTKISVLLAASPASSVEDVQMLVNSFNQLQKSASTLRDKRRTNEILEELELIVKGIQWHTGRGVQEVRLSELPSIQTLTLENNKR